MTESEFQVYSLGLVSDETVGLIFDGLVDFVLLGGNVQANDEHDAADVHDHVAVGYVELLQVLRLMEHVLVMMAVLVGVEHVQSVKLGQAGEDIDHVSQGQHVDDFEAEPVYVDLYSNDGEDEFVQLAPACSVGKESQDDEDGGDDGVAEDCLKEAHFDF